MLLLFDEINGSTMLVMNSPNLEISQLAPALRNVTDRQEAI